jgi:ABC-type uncharacterized transport system substrate-binding protein
MRELGYVEGRHFVVEARFATDDNIERLAALAAELLQANVNIIVASDGLFAARSLKQATPTVPVVLAIMMNPVREGHAASLVHPGGNFTGLAAFIDEVFAKHVEVLKLAVPNLSRIAAVVSKNSGRSAS